MASEWAGDSAGAEPVGPGDLRVSDAEREEVVGLLRGHTGAGRLQLDEFEERSGLAFAARTRRELEVLLRDLPVGGPSGERPGREGPGSGRPDRGQPGRGRLGGEWPSGGEIGRRRSGREWSGGESSGGEGSGGEWSGSRRSSCHGRPTGGGGPHRAVGGGAWRQSPFVFVAVLMIGIWLATGLHGYFWPVWVIGPWGLSILFGHGRRPQHRHPVSDRSL